MSPIKYTVYMYSAFAIWAVVKGTVGRVQEDSD